LSGWKTPNLTSATNIFFGGNARILDISNWDTSKITSFSAGIHSVTKVGVLYPAYLIMDKEEVKFSGNYIFGNIANCKYLVPEDMVDAYKQHPNWQSRAS
jgi:surface protein